MPTPVPTPTAAQIVTVAEIAMVSTDAAASMVTADSTQEISDAKWSATLLDIASWTGGVGRDAGDVKRVDQIEFFEGAAANARLDIRNAVRMRYGLSFISSEAANAANVNVSSLKWF
jgi:hypothetical protein